MSIMAISRRIALAVAALALTATAAGCGSASGGSGSTLVVYDGSSGQFTEDFNPFTPTPLTAAWGMIYQPLMYFNMGRAGDVQPLLATGYQWSDGGKTLTFTLRQHMKWSDGQPITTADVLYVFNTLEANPEINSYSVPYAGATAPDATHVAVHFTEPAYSYLWYVAGKTWIVPQHIWQHITNPTTNPNTSPVGSGPYTLDNFSPQGYTLTKNANYWDTGKPKVPEVRFVSFSGNQPAVNALVSGQVDWMGGFIPDIDKTYVAKDPSANRYLNTPQFITVLVPNLDAGPLTDLAVRQAIYYGMDRNQINTLAFSGYSTPASAGLLLLPRDQQYQSAEMSQHTPSYDPAKAEQILQQAGYHKGADGIYVSPQGTRLSLTVKVISGYTDWISALQVMKAQLAKIGIDLETQVESYSAQNNDMETGNFQLTITNLYGGPNPFYLYNDFLNSANTKPIGQLAVHNYARFRDPAVDAALTAIAGTDDQAAQQQAYDTIEHEVATRLPYIPIMQSSTLTEMDAGQFTGWPTQNNLYALPMPFYGPDMGVVAANLVPAG